MAESIHGEINQALASAGGLYYRLVLLAGNPGSGKTLILRNVAEALGVTIINVNLALSGELLELTAKQRVLRLPGIFGQIVAQAPAQPVVLDNLEILFEESIKQDPLRLLQNVSRNRTVVAAWNGTVVDNRLLYAEINHPEYRSYDSVDALIINMDGTATVDSATN